MDPMLMGIGPYNYGGMTAASTLSGADSLPAIASSNEMMMFPFLQNYQSQVDGLDAMAHAATTPAVTTPTIDTSKWYEQIQENQTKMMDFNLRQQERYRLNSFSTTAPLVKIDNAAMILNEKIVQNEQDQIPAAMANFVSAVKEAYDPEGKMDEETLLAQANTIYMQKTGKTFQADIRDNGHNAVTGGFLRSFCLGMFGDKVTPEENISKINKQPVSEKAQMMQKIGKVAGWAGNGVVAGATAGAIAGGCFMGIGAIPGAIAGAGYGLIAGALTGLASLFT